MKAIETSFLEIGNIIENTANISNTLVTQSSHLVALAEGPEGGNHRVEEASAHLHSALEFANNSDRQVTDFINCLESTVASIRQTFPAQQELSAALSPLKYVQILFRVESASLADEVRTAFLALNDEIARICQRVESGFQEKFAIITSIAGQLEAAVRDLKIRQARTRETLLALKASLEKSISSVQAGYTESQSRNSRLGEISRQISKDTGTVVFSLQAQDMLSQKFQHIRSILKEITAQYQAMPANKPGACRTLRFIEQASSIVSAQLDVMKQELCDAGTKVTGGLNLILGQMTGLNEEFAILQKNKSEKIDIDSAMQMMIEAIEGMAKVMQASGELVAETHRTIDPIRKLSTNFTSYMCDLTLDIRLIGLNAQVQAAHVASGTGLEVLSARASDVSTTTSHMSDQLAATIDNITRQLAENIEAFGRIRDETKAYAARLSEETARDADHLHDYRDKVITTLFSLAEQLPQLEAQANSAIQHADFSGLTVAQLDNLRRDIESLRVEATSQADALGIQIDTTGMTDQFIKGYTMRSQVDTHLQALGSKTATPAANTPAPPAPADDVVFFGFDDPPAEAPVAAAASPQPAADCDIDLWGDEPAASPVAASTPAPPAPAQSLDVELWGDEPPAETTPAPPPRQAA